MSAGRDAIRARRYLLGEASEEECAAIEGECLGNEAAADEIAAIEEDLVEDFLADRLTPEERRGFPGAGMTGVETMSPPFRARALKTSSAWLDKT